VFSQFAEWPIEHAIVIDNDVTMSPPEGTVFTADSAGISIRGFAQDNLVVNNRIHGRAAAALSVAVYRGGIPSNNAFVLNRFNHFEASQADVFVGNGVMNTFVVEPGTVDDLGTGTILVPGFLFIRPDWDENQTTELDKTMGNSEAWSTLNPRQTNDHEVNEVNPVCARRRAQYKNNWSVGVDSLFQAQIARVG
jgi:hypothetical protein